MTKHILHQVFPKVEDVTGTEVKELAAELFKQGRLASHRTSCPTELNDCRQVIEDLGVAYYRYEMSSKVAANIYAKRDEIAALYTFKAEHAPEGSHLWSLLSPELLEWFKHKVLDDNDTDVWALVNHYEAGRDNLQLEYGKLKEELETVRAGRDEVLQALNGQTVQLNRAVDAYGRIVIDRDAWKASCAVAENGSITWAAKAGQLESQLSEAKAQIETSHVEFGNMRTSYDVRVEQLKRHLAEREADLDSALQDLKGFTELKAFVYTLNADPNFAPLATREPTPDSHVTREVYNHAVERAADLEEQIIRLKARCFDNDELIKSLEAQVNFD